MQTYQIADTAGQHVATVTASSHRRAALSISCHRDETDIHPVIQGDGRSGCIDDAYGVHLMVEGRELVVTDVELATDTRPEPELVEGGDDDALDMHTGPIHAHSLMPAEPVQLDPLAAAHRLADAVTHELAPYQIPDGLRSALAAFREATR